MFIGRNDDKPISIILTTFAAHSYQGEERISDALFAILSKMDSFIKQAADGTFIIENPSDPLENFADKWKKHPERALARSRQRAYAWVIENDLMRLGFPGLPKRSIELQNVRYILADLVSVPSQHTTIFLTQPSPCHFRR